MEVKRERQINMRLGGHFNEVINWRWSGHYKDEATLDSQLNALQCRYSSGGQLMLNLEQIKPASGAIDNFIASQCFFVKIFFNLVLNSCVTIQHGIGCLCDNR